MEQIWPKNLEVLNAGYLEKTIKEVFPFQMATMSTSIPKFKMGKTFKRLRGKCRVLVSLKVEGCQVKGKKFRWKKNGNNCSLIGKQVEKMIRGEQGELYLHDDLLLRYSQRHVAQMIVEQK